MQIRWGLAAAALLGAVLLFPRAAAPLLVGGLVFGWLLWRSSPGRTSTRSTGEERQLVMTPSTTVAGLVALAGFGVGSIGGSTLGIFVCFAILGVAALDLGVAVFVTRKVTATLSASRTEIFTGDTVDANLELTGPKLPVAVRVGPSSVLGLEASDDEPMTVKPNIRVAIVSLQVEVRSTGLCGIVGMVKRWPVPLTTPLSVGPRPLAPAGRLDLGPRRGDGWLRQSAVGDVVRGVRDYVPGDRRSQVHWKATARAGRLVVKEVEEPVAPALTLLLDLGRGGPAGEEAAARAAWYLEEALQQGAEVVLATCEPGDRLFAPVGSTAEVIRRLARATVGPPPEPAVPRGGRLLRVTPQGDTWD